MKNDLYKAYGLLCMIAALFIVFLLSSCGASDDIISGKKKAKVRLIDTPILSDRIHFGEFKDDVVMKYVNDIYNIGDTVRIMAYRYVILSLEDSDTTVPARDYQVQLAEDTVLIFDGRRLVGGIPLKENDALSEVIYMDNE